MRFDRSSTRDPLPPFGALPDTGEQRKLKDKRLLVGFKRSLPALVIVVVLGVALLGLQFGAWRGNVAAQSGQWERAEQKFARQETITRWWPARWVAQYNRGTALLQMGELESGRAALEEAFENVPKATPDEDGKLQAYTYECQVRLNLAVSWEAAGDQMREEKDPEGAVAQYDQGLEWAEPCQLSGGGDGEPSEGGLDDQPQPQPSQSELDEGASTADRIEDKRDQAQREADGEEEQPSGGESPGEPQEGEDQQEPEDDPFAGETQEERDRREELEQRNQDQAEREREKSESESRRTDSGGW